MVRERPVEDREFKAVIAKLGFVRRKRTGTTHEIWAKGSGKDFRRVTVDAHHAPYHRNLLRMMLREVGISKSDFFEILDTI